ncbi:hypothetical protein [Rossellomorea marisflavi]|uniref:hypothetical protein n=1 Tax=Rossellomorea marisflavi TaxID=189381 RepID=UPI0039955745
MNIEKGKWRNEVKGDSSELFSMRLFLYNLGTCASAWLQGIRLQNEVDALGCRPPILRTSMFKIR